MRISLNLRFRGLYLAQVHASLHASATDHSGRTDTFIFPTILWSLG
jgi:hypothetical protein